MVSCAVLRPLVGGLSVLPVLGSRRRGPASCQGDCCSKKDKPDFVSAQCTKNEPHTHNTRLITLKLPANWTASGAVANVVVRAAVAGPKEAGCCACCKCPPPCSCPKTANGCCACCKCPGTCGCPKVVPAAAPAKKEETGCCACCPCPPPCSCPKTANGCCACCKCPGTCSCPKKEAPTSSAVSRPYNPLSAASGDSVTLLVKKYADSKMGTKLHNLQVGENVEVRGPNKQWSFERGKYKHYAMVAGGTGITPLIQATEHILQNDNASVTMVTFNKNTEDVLLRKELARLEVMYGCRFAVVHVVETAPGNGSTYLQGSPSTAILKELLPKPRDGVLVMVCGRKEMTEAVAGPKTPDFQQGQVDGMLKDLGYKEEHVWKL